MVDQWRRNAAIEGRSRYRLLLGLAARRGVAHTDPEPALLKYATSTRVARQLVVEDQTLTALIEEMNGAIAVRESLQQSLEVALRHTSLCRLQAGLGKFSQSELASSGVYGAVRETAEALGSAYFSHRLLSSAYRHWRGLTTQAERIRRAAQSGRRQLYKYFFAQWSRHTLHARARHNVARAKQAPSVYS